MRYKASKYNILSRQGDGSWLIFGCIGNGLARMDERGYHIYQRFVESPTELQDLAGPDREVAERLRQGQIMLPGSMDELSFLRATHYRARFSRTGLALTVLPTFECNFACDYCYQGKQATPGVMGPDIQEALVRFASRNLFPGAVLWVTWYGGEPLLCREVIASLSERFSSVCREKGASYRSGIITNGYLLSPETVLFLEKAQVKAVQITLDGPEDVHDARRPLAGGGRTYARGLQAILSLAEGSDTDITVRINIDRRNENAVSPLLEELAARGLARFPRVTITIAQVQAATVACADVDSHCHSAHEFSQRELELIRVAHRLGFRKKKYPRRTSVNCEAITGSHFVVEPDGTLQKCWNAVGQPDKAVGHVVSNQTTAHDLYRSNDAKWLGWDPFVGECPTCPIFPLCLGGCPFKALYTTEVGPVSNGRCPSPKFNIAELLAVFAEAERSRRYGSERAECPESHLE